MLVSIGGVRKGLSRGSSAGFEALRENRLGAPPCPLTAFLTGHGLVIVEGPARFSAALARGVGQPAALEEAWKTSSSSISGFVIRGGLKTGRAPEPLLFSC